MTEKILTGILILAALAVLLLGLSFIRALNRMQKLIRDYEEKGAASFSTMKETRESKLENRLQRLLGQAAGKEEKDIFGRNEDDRENSDRNPDSGCSGSAAAGTFFYKSFEPDAKADTGL